MDRALKILLVEDAEMDAELQFRELRRSGIRFEARRVQTESDFLVQITDGVRLPEGASRSELFGLMMNRRTGFLAGEGELNVDATLARSRSPSSFSIWVRPAAFTASSWLRTA